MAVVDFDAVNQTKVINVDRDFGVVNLFNRLDDRVLQCLVAFSRNRRGLLCKEAFKVIFLALKRFDRAFDTRFGRRFDAVYFFDFDAVITHPNIL